MANKGFYDIPFNHPNGTPYPVNSLKGKTVLVVNTATQCGLTPQFEGLELLHNKYKEKGLVVLGFPCNQFGGQEPLTNENMVEACAINHNVSFDLMEKIKVNGESAHPLFKWLKSKKGGLLGSRIKWNFTKFLINSEGKVLKRYAPVTQPEKIEADISALLK